MAIPKLIPKQQVNSSHKRVMGQVVGRNQRCLWSVPSCLTIPTIVSDMSSSSNREGKVPSALLYSFFSLKSVIQPKKTLNLIQIVSFKTMCDLAPLKHFFPVPQLLPTSNAIFLKSPITMGSK